MGYFQRNFTFSRQEQLDIALTSVISSLIIFMFVWRTTPFTLSSGLFQAVLILICSFLVLGMYVSFTKLMALMYQYKAHYERWTTGMLVGFVFTFISYGFLPILFPGTLEVERMRRLSYGKTFQMEEKRHIFAILSGGLWLTMVAGMIFQVFYQLSGIEVFAYLMYGIGALSIFSVLPLQKTIGVQLFYVARRKYYFVLALGITFGLLLLFNVPFSMLFALILTAIFGSLLLKNPIEA